ncbi:MAG TPA: spore germination protein GerW family protein [Acidimicrobiales bacterium]|nr:spore germination protein GerW family protein [Acidimicrobiales bacterium]
MEANEVISQARDTMTVKRVFGEPYERNGVTVIPVASIRGGAGGGQGEGSGRAQDSPQATGSGSGGGFGLVAKPAGVYIIEGDDVRWQPAVDVNRIVLGGQIVAIALFLVLRSIFRRH